MNNFIMLDNNNKEQAQLIGFDQRAWAGMRAYMLEEDIVKFDIPAQYSVTYPIVEKGIKKWKFILSFYNPAHECYASRYENAVDHRVTFSADTLTTGMQKASSLINAWLKACDRDLIIKLEIPKPAHPDSYTEQDMAEIIGDI